MLELNGIRRDKRIRYARNDVAAMHQTIAAVAEFAVVARGKCRTAGARHAEGEHGRRCDSFIKGFFRGQNRERGTETVAGKK